MKRDRIEQAKLFWMAFGDDVMLKAWADLQRSGSSDWKESIDGVVPPDHDWTEINGKKFIRDRNKLRRQQEKERSDIQKRREYTGLEDSFQLIEMSDKYTTAIVGRTRAHGYGHIVTTDGNILYGKSLKSRPESSEYPPGRSVQR